MSAYNTTVPSAVDDATEEPYYRFVSNDNREFKVSGKAIEQSETLHALVGNLFHTKEEREVNVIPLDTCDGTTLDLVFKWCEEYKGKSFPEDESTTPMKIVIPDFDAKLLNIDDDTLFNLICAANYLNVRHLMKVACKKVSLMAKGKSAAELRVIFGIPTNDEYAKKAAE